MSEWNMERMKIRQKMEIEGGGFGKGNVISLFVEGDEFTEVESYKTSEDKSNMETLKVSINMHVYICDCLHVVVHTIYYTIVGCTHICIQLCTTLLVRYLYVFC